MTVKLKGNSKFNHNLVSKVLNNSNKLKKNIKV